MTEAPRRVALVTGGGRGIGRAISLRLARDGADVAVNFHRDEESAASTVADIEVMGGRAKAYRASVESWDDDAAMVDAVLADFGRVDILVHNGGIASRGHTVAQSDPDEMERVVRTHAFGPFYLSKLLVPQMRELVAPTSSSSRASRPITTPPAALRTTWARRPPRRWR